MSWHYAARKVEDDFGEDLYELVEVYTDLHGSGKDAWTQNAVTVCGDSKSDLAKWLRQAADDVEKYDVIIEEKL